MRTVKTLFIILSIAVTAIAQQKTPPAPGAARPINLPKITEKKLANGLTVVLAPLPNVPKITSILAFKGAGTSADRERHPAGEGHRAPRLFRLTRRNRNHFVAAEA